LKTILNSKTLMDLSTHSMVPLEFFGIALAFLIMTALSLWILIGAKGHWVFKMGFIAITLLFSIGMWNSFNDLLGWPTTEKVPDKFEILWVVVEEPNKRTNDDGAIYIWIKNLEPKDDSFSLSFNSKDVSKGSRLYKLPYNRAMHEQVPGILGKIKRGERYIATMGNGVGGDGQGEGEGEGEGLIGRQGQGQEGQGQGSHSQEQDPVFHQLPPSRFPPKNP